MGPGANPASLRARHAFVCHNAAPRQTATSKAAIHARARPRTFNAPMKATTVIMYNVVGPRDSTVTLPFFSFAFLFAVLFAVLLAVLFALVFPVAFPARRLLSHPCIRLRSAEATHDIVYDSWDARSRCGPSPTRVARGCPAQDASSTFSARNIRFGA